MTTEVEFEKIVNARLEECKRILLQRNRVYSNKDNFFENFQISGVMLTTAGFSFHGKPVSPEAVALIYDIFKLQRRSNAIKLGITHPDNWTDGINYILIQEGCHRDE